MGAWAFYDMHIEFNNHALGSTDSFSSGDMLRYLIFVFLVDCITVCVAFVPLGWVSFDFIRDVEVTENLIRSLREFSDTF